MDYLGGRGESDIDRAPEKSINDITSQYALVILCPRFYRKDPFVDMQVDTVPCVHSHVIDSDRRLAWS